MVLSQSGLGFNPLSLVKRVATDSRAQRLAVAAGQAYAPEQVATAQRYASQAQQILHARVVTPPAPRQRMPMMPMPPMPTDVNDDGALPPGTHASQGNLIGIAAVAGAGLILFLVLRR